MCKLQHKNKYGVPSERHPTRQIKLYCFLSLNSVSNVAEKVAGDPPLITTSVADALIPDPLKLNSVRRKVEVGPPDGEP
jgi:hypothetical protein